jgi:hypothetical protein
MGAVDGVPAPEGVAVRFATHSATGTATRTTTQNGRRI